MAYYNSAYTGAQIDAAVGAVASKADDTAVVHNTGNETIDGVKTFSSFPVTPSSVPTANYQVANKKYIDDKVKTDVPVDAKFTDTITTVNGKTGAITKDDIVALGIPAQDTVYEKILAQTVGTAAQSISLDLSGIDTRQFSGIVVLAQVLTSLGTVINCTINNITTGYYGNTIASAGSTVTSISNKASFGGFKTFPTSTTNNPIPIRLEINQAYFGTDNGNTSITFAGGKVSGSQTNGHIFGAVGVPNNADISSIQFIADSGNILTGSKFLVYGVRA